MDGRVTPIHGQAFFGISQDSTFFQILVFDYLDAERSYYRLLEDEQAYRESMQNLLASMNALLSEEEILINDRRVNAEALTVNLDFRGGAERPTISFYIEFRGELRRPGENVYECMYEPGTAEYDYEVHWFLPRDSKILRVETSTSYEVYGDRFLVMWARAGDRYDGYEKIVFALPPP